MVTNSKKTKKQKQIHPRVHPSCAAFVCGFLKRRGQGGREGDGGEKGGGVCRPEKVVDKGEKRRGAGERFVVVVFYLVLNPVEP